MESKYIEVSFAKKIYVSGVVVAAGDTVKLHLVTEHQALDSFPTVDVTVVRVINGGRGIVFDRTVAGKDFLASQIAGVHAQHDGTCPASCDFLLEALEDAVASVEVDGNAISLPNFSYAVTAAGAAALQADLRNWLLSNHPAGFPQPYVTVTWNDLATDTLDISITGSRLDFETVNDSDAFVNSCDPEE